MTEERLIAGRYELLAEIGRGGMGVVYRTHDRQLGRLVALKLVAPVVAADEELRRRFLREAHALARVRSAGVVSVHDAGTEDEQPWLVMDLCQEGSLADRLAGGPLAASEVRELLSQTAAALAAIHQAGIVHRDLKPANVLRNDGRWLIGDFGIAAATGESTITRTGMVMGTPEYWAPELVNDDAPVGPEADVYSLGCVLYHSLTGAPPYRAANPLRVGLMHASEPVPAIPVPVRDDDPELSALIERMLQKPPSDRPRVRELVAATGMAGSNRVDVAAEHTAEDEERSDEPAPETPRDPGITEEATPRTLIDTASAETVVTPDEPPTEAMTRGGRRRTLLIAASVLAGVLVIAGAGGATFALTRDGKAEFEATAIAPAEEIIVPRVTGMSLASARKRIADEARPFRIDIPSLKRARTVYSENRPRGRIISQRPRPGTRLDADGTIAVVLSKGTAFAEVPASSGSVQAVRARLRDAGFAAKVSEVPSFEVDAGVVLGADPAPGTRARRPGPVSVTVSSGPRPDAIVVAGDTSIGGWETGAAGNLGGYLGAARRILGEPASPRPFDSIYCDVRWDDLGMTGTFYNLGGAPPCSDDYQMRTVQMRGPRFVTDRGLAIGSSLERLQTLYSTARTADFPDSDGQVWILAERYLPFGDGGNAPSLTAVVADGEVVRLDVSFPSGGD